MTIYEIICITSVLQGFGFCNMVHAIEHRKG